MSRWKLRTASCKLPAPVHLVTHQRRIIVFPCMQTRALSLIFSVWLFWSHHKDTSPRRSAAWSLNNSHSLYGRQIKLSKPATRNWWMQIIWWWGVNNVIISVNEQGWMCKSCPEDGADKQSVKWKWFILTGAWILILTETLEKKFLKNPRQFSPSSCENPD